MASIFVAQNIKFKKEFSDFLRLRKVQRNEIETIVSEMLSKIKEEGDLALIDYTKKFDKFDLVKEGFAFSNENIDSSDKFISEGEKLAINLAIDRVSDFHKYQMPKDFGWTDNIGVDLGWTWKSIQKVGVYVPGGTASYPSSVIMNVIPAKVAGVTDLVMCSPTPKGNYNPMVLYAAKKLGIKTIYRIGGAQAIAALALGTNTITKVDKVTGPGNSYVSEAKRQLVGEVGIDSLAGPSEVVIISDSSFSPKLAAIDLLAQAEHDKKSQSILITNDQAYAKEVEKEVYIFLQKLKRREIAKESWRSNGAIIIVQSLEDGINLSNDIAPEHLQLCFKDADKQVKNVKNAGSVFIGNWSPEVLGDYISGSNHVLPTNGSAKYSSSLSVYDFLKRISITKLDRQSFGILAPATITLANSEGLEAHALSISERLKKINE